jgi:serine/threonine protein kinase
MDRYHIYEEIGKGNYSQVYKGREKKKIEYVAIKRVDKNMMSNVRLFPSLKAQQVDVISPYLSLSCQGCQRSPDHAPALSSSHHPI